MARPPAAGCGGELAPLEVAGSPPVGIPPGGLSVTYPWAASVSPTRGRPRYHPPWAASVSPGPQHAIAACHPHGNG